MWLLIRDLLLEHTNRYRYGGNEGQNLYCYCSSNYSQPETVSVSGIATNATCFGETDGSIAVTNSEGATVVITNANNDVVANTGLVAGTY
jgi:type II secretory pathway pseudopilin PulG